MRRPSAALAALAALAVALAACAPAPTPAPSAAPTPVASASAAATAVPSVAPSPAPSPTAAGMSLAGIRVAPRAFAKVQGSAIAMAPLGDGTGRLLVATQEGRIWLVGKDGAVASTPFLDIRSRVSCCGERGLLGVAVHPGFPADPRIFVDYTDVNGDTAVSSFTAVLPGATHADPHSERIVLAQQQPYPNHNGGDVHFGPDGYLYIGFGDGGSADDPMGNGQKLSTLLGKVVRIDVDHHDGLRNYAIPPTNPFVGRTDARPEIWLVGVRNPWRYSFDPANGDLWIGDVGQDKWEEVDVVRGGTGGANLGWDLVEATHCHDPRSNCRKDGLLMPVAEYSHANGCAVVGGVVYRGAAYPFLDGAYLFTDYCTPIVHALAAPTAGPGLTRYADIGGAPANTASFGVDDAGEVYALTLDGLVERLTFTRS